MKHTIALFTAITSLAGCSEDPPEEYYRIILSTLLNATWTSECIVEGTDSYLPTLVFSTNGGALYNSGTGTSSKIYHTDDTACSTLVPEITDINTFSYTLGDNVIVDGTVAEITEATEIDTINTTEGSPDAGAAEYDIFAIKDKYTLYFGNKDLPTDGSTVDLRPTQLSGTAVYTR